MNWIDLFLIVIFLLSVWGGWRKGFIVSSIELATWTGSIGVGFIFYEKTADWLGAYFNLGEWALPVAFIGVIIVASMIISLILNLFIRATPDHVHAHGVNKFLGLVPGSIKGILNAIIIATLLLALPLWKLITEEARQSRIANTLAVQSSWIDEKLSPVFNDAISRSINRLTVHPKSNETVKLNFTVNNPTVREDLETQMLIMVNNERRKAGLPDLKPDPELTKVARAHSKDMFARGYFSHFTLESKTLADRLRSGGVNYTNAGENLALAPTIRLAHSNLMNSPGHRANILHKGFGYLGIGVLDGGIRGLMVTQNFRN
ncbi:CvpA family protein [Chitinophagaceae bacterium LB-8]|uniref:CvpA family protein n=1 Tax=Paraflavisolibacter caeni TaxID=2982496 RepID=A0A9X2XP28_9BACT|nr:CvpA family protein [Paraflavisolibacter caeni]MCU7550288.1 CvpA family protein [Paraflavisolibacter caeni]